MKWPQSVGRLIIYRHNFQLFGLSLSPAIFHNAINSLTPYQDEIIGRTPSKKLFDERMRWVLDGSIRHTFLSLVLVSESFLPSDLLVRSIYLRNSFPRDSNCSSPLQNASIPKSVLTAFAIGFAPALYSIYFELYSHNSNSIWQKLPGFPAREQSLPGLLHFLSTKVVPRSYYSNALSIIIIDV